MLIRAPSIFFILAVSCWCGHNNAIPLTFHSSRINQDAITKKETNFHNNRDDTVRFRARRMAEPFAVASDKKSVITTESLSTRRSLRNRNKNYNVNENMNINIVGRGNLYRSHKRRDKHHSAATSKKSENKLFGITEEDAANCVSGKKKNQRYTSSFVNSTNNLSFDQEFDKLVGNNSKAKILTSVHEGEDMTLCWIETTTIKEDKNVSPPKRLVLREYTISFENSATIPDRYLECKRLEGELLANDPEIGKTALFEIIDENTRVSRVVNFTSVSHDGDIIDWQYKTVKCGVGPVVTKNIIEYTKSDNPKKRVEIKVSPKINLLTAKKSDEEPCTDSSSEESSTDKSNVTESCENGSCGVTTISNEILTKSQEIVTTEKTVSESPSYEDSDEILKLSTGVTKKLLSKVTKVTVAPKISTISEKNLDCNENPLDPECLRQIDVTLSSKELSTEFSVELPTTETTEKSETSTSKKQIIPNLSDHEISTEEESSNESSIEEDKSISDSSSTKETSLVTSDISIESSESATIQSINTEFTTISKSFDYYDHIITTLKPVTTTPTVTKKEIEQKRATSEEITEEISSSELIKKELENVSDNVLFSSEISTIPSAITTIPPIEHLTETIISVSKEEKSEEQVTSENEETTEQSTETILSASKEEESKEVITSESEDTTEQSTEIIISASKEEESEEPVTSESEETTEQSTETILSASKEEEVIISESEETTEQSTETILSASKEKESEEIITSKSKETTEQSTETILSVSKEEGSEEVITSESKETAEQSTETIISKSKEEESEEVITSESEETTEQSTIISASKEEESEEIKTSENEETIEQSTEISASKEKESEETTTEKIKTTKKDKLTDLPMASLSSSESESSCENSEDCISLEACDESEDCSSTTKKSCESETCSEEETDESKSDTSSIITESSEEATGSEIEYTTPASDHTTISQEEEIVLKGENVPTTVETRRSTLSDQRHKWNLKIKILLEHVDENEKKHNLVEVEKHLSLPEDTEYHENPDLIEQLKSLNDSVNMEALNALLNCTTLGNLTNDSHISEISSDTNEKTFKESNLSSEEDSQYSDTKLDREHEIISRRRRRRNVEEIQDTIKDLGSSQNDDSTTKKDEQLSTTTNSIAEETTVVLIKDNINFTTPANTLEETNGTVNPIKNNANSTATYNLEEETTDGVLSSTQETYLSTTTNSTEEETADGITIENENITFNIKNESTVVPTGETSKNKEKIGIVQQALFKLREDISTGFQRIMSQLHSNLALLNDESKTDKPDLLDIISDPRDDRIHSRKRREVTEEQLGHWSNERIGETPMGSKLRSFTEFTLYKSFS